MATVVNGAKRKRPGTWIVDFRDAQGHRRWLSFNSREEAQHKLADILKMQKHREPSAVSVDITVGDYVEQHWRPIVAARAKRRTVEVYDSVWKHHLEPTLGSRKIRTIERQQIRKMLASKMSTSARGAVRLMMAVGRTLFAQAIDDGIIQSNPFVGQGKALRLVESKATRAERIKAMTAQQQALFLSTTAGEPSRYLDLFLFLARTGVRIGEALGLRWSDLDLSKGTARIERAFSKRRFESPKAGHARTIDLGPDVVARLMSRMVEVGSSPDAPVFSTTAGTPMDESKCRKSMMRILAAAGLPHFSAHDLRHTYASLHLQSGTPIQYVQRQLGHASISLTSDIYGKWMPNANVEHAAKLDRLVPLTRVVDKR